MTSGAARIYMARRKRIGATMDPEKTIPPAGKASAAYREAEAWFDDVLTVLLSSRITLAVLVLTHGIAFAAGLWLAW